MTRSKNGKPTLPTSFWLDEETRTILDELTKELNTSRSAVVRDAIKLMKSEPKMASVRRLVAELSKAVSGR